MWDGQGEDASEAPGQAAHNQQEYDARCHTYRSETRPGASGSRSLRMFSDALICDSVEWRACARKEGNSSRRKASRPARLTASLQESVSRCRAGRSPRGLFRRAMFQRASVFTTDAGNGPFVRAFAAIDQRTLSACVCLVVAEVFEAACNLALAGRGFNSLLPLIVRRTAAPFLLPGSDQPDRWALRSRSRVSHPLDRFSTSRAGGVQWPVGFKRDGYPFLGGIVATLGDGLVVGRFELFAVDTRGEQGGSLLFPKTIPTTKARYFTVRVDRAGYLSSIARP